MFWAFRKMCTTSVGSDFKLQGAVPLFVMNRRHDGKLGRFEHLLPRTVSTLQILFLDVSSDTYHVDSCIPGCTFSYLNDCKDAHVLGSFAKHTRRSFEGRSANSAYTILLGRG